MSQNIENKIFNDVEASIAYLNHSRTMLIHAANVRLKNFNFFLVASGLIILAFTNVVDPLIVIIIAGLGFGLSIIFILLDIRTYQLIKVALIELKEIEPRFYIIDKAPNAIRETVPAGGFRIISHTFGYRAIYLMMAVVFLLWSYLKCTG